MIDRGPWHLSYTGRQVHPLDIRPEEINILDIAHSLSNLCRFNGHCREFYSVAQHSMIVSNHLRSENVLTGLLHDATEAYVGDLIRPIKRAIPMFEEMEYNIWKVIAYVFDLPIRMPDEVKVVDNRVLQTERRDLLPEHPWLWKEDQIDDGTVIPYTNRIVPMSAKESESLFLGLYEEYTRKV